VGKDANVPHVGSVALQLGDLLTRDVLSHGHMSTRVRERR
jgi:hypothetical protein